MTVGSIVLPGGCGPGSPGPATTGAITVLVVDDSLVDRRLAGGIVERKLGLKVSYAGNGLEALAAIDRQGPSIVLTDLEMPEMNGLELVETVRRKYPVPVILMTAHGSEDIAVQALQKGAASYVPKKNLARDLIPTIKRVLAAAEVDQQRRRVMENLVASEFHFRLGNDPAAIPPLVSLLQENLVGLDLCDETGRCRIGIALAEALLNAVCHGNLEVSSDLRQDDDRPYVELIERRRCEPPYRDRKVTLHAKISGSEAVYTIRDEGPGFDPSRVPDPTDPANLERTSGRGLLLIQTFMDEVTYADFGTQITMIKHRDAAHAE